MQTAERWAIPADEMARWVSQLKIPPTEDAAEHWAEAYDAIRQHHWDRQEEEDTTPGSCAHCGAPIRNAKEAAEHTCRNGAA